MLVLQFTNEQIYQIFNNIQQYLVTAQQNVMLPLKPNFYLLKNYKTFTALVEEIETMREAVGKKYGTLQEDGTYFVEGDNLSIAQQELQELGNIEQSVEIYTISLEDLKDIELTTKQMEALLFMIEDEEEKKEN